MKFPTLLFLLCCVAETCSGQSPATKMVGVAPQGQVAFEYIGIVKQDDESFETYGYFTYIKNVPPELMFFDATDRTEQNARFTFHSRSEMTARSIVDTVFSVNADGKMDIYIRKQPHRAAAMGRPRDFAVGVNIADIAFRGQSIVAVTKPKTGINSAVLEGTQTGRRFRFRIQDTIYEFGRVGSRFRFSHIGSGTLEQKEPPIATLTIAGRAVTVAPSN